MCHDINNELLTNRSHLLYTKVIADSVRLFILYIHAPSKFFLMLIKSFNK